MGESMHPSWKNIVKKYIIIKEKPVFGRNYLSCLTSFTVAAINILYTNQTSGVKIKLLNALYNGHYCLANKEMLTGSGLEELCRIIPDNPKEILDIIKKCLRENFSETEIIKREKRLNQLYNNTQNAHNIINIAFEF
jgi:hypothetical protein